jgi:hypothetical protein
MEFYLNQKSLPLIRRCQNCKFYNPNNQLCIAHTVHSAYDHHRDIYLKTSDNLYCNKHNFEKEQELKETAVTIELPSIQAAMDIINERKNNSYNKPGAYNI